MIPDIPTNAFVNRESQTLLRILELRDREIEAGQSIPIEEIVTEFSNCRSGRKTDLQAAS
ncbi:MAG: hypothetical protein ABSF23_07820 [Terracidiphilus sp.]|jgi:hypothetical protein